MFVRVAFVERRFSIPGCVEKWNSAGKPRRLVCLFVCSWVGQRPTWATHPGDQPWRPTLATNPQRPTMRPSFALIAISRMLGRLNKSETMEQYWFRSWMVGWLGGSLFLFVSMLCQLLPRIKHRSLRLLENSF